MGARAGLAALREAINRGELRIGFLIAGLAALPVPESSEGIAMRWGIYALGFTSLDTHHSAVNWESVVGDNIKSARKARGLTQEQLAEFAGLDLRYLGSIERGKGNPSVNVLGRIAQALKVKPGDLFEERVGPTWD